MDTESFQTSFQSGTELLSKRIQEHPFFHGLPLHTLPTLAAAAMDKKFAAGEVIFNVGEPANRMYLIEKGLVRLSAEDPEGRLVTLQTLGPGQVLGWSWLLPPHYWRFRAEALEPVQSVFLYGSRLREIAESDPAFGYPLMKRIATVVLERLQDVRARLVAESSKH